MQYTEGKLGVFNAPAVVDLSKTMTIKDASKMIEDMSNHIDLNLDARPSPERLAQIRASYFFPIPPSDVYIQMLSDVLEVTASKPLSGMVSPSKMITSGVCTSTMVSTAEDSIRRYAHVIANAKQEVLLGASFMKKGRNTELISHALVELSKRIGERNKASGRSDVIPVKVIYSHGPQFPQRKMIMDLKKLAKLNFPSPENIPNLRLEVLRFNHSFQGVFHCKFLIIDRKIVLNSSANLLDMVNLEMCVQYEGDIVNSFYDLFMISWENDNRFLLADFPASNPTKEAFKIGVDDSIIPDLPTDNSRTLLDDFPPSESKEPRLEEAPGFKRVYRHKPHDPFPMVLVNRSPTGYPGHTSDAVQCPQNMAWIAAFKYAKRKVFIQTPMLNSKPILEAMKEAIKRDIQIIVWLSWNYDGMKEMLPFQGGTNTHVIHHLEKELEKMGKRQNLTVKWYTAKDKYAPIESSEKQRNCHVKYMEVDDEIAIIGSGNLDTQSIYHSMEVNVMMYAPELIKEWQYLLHNNQNTEQYGVLHDVKLLYKLR